MTAPAVYYHPLFLEHETGDHPENKQRLVVARKALLESALELEWVTPEPASVEDVARGLLASQGLSDETLTVVTATLAEQKPIRDSLAQVFPPAVLDHVDYDVVSTFMDELWPPK